MIVNFVSGSLFKQIIIVFVVLHLGFNNVSYAKNAAELIVQGENSFLTQSQKIVSASELNQAILQGLDRVAEFEYLRRQAKELGIRVWLFGGTASSYAHYSRRDYLRLMGETQYHPDRFDYSYLSIFRSTQDLDIVIDGNEEQAKELESRLKAKFKHIQGSKGDKSVWEVRLLREKMGDKDAILSHDFQNQHSDSNSTGMIEVTDPPHNESRIRDSRDFNNQKDPLFLEDIRKGEITFYHSDKHFTTSRAKSGLNPEILAVIRYLTKAFQEELKLKEKDLIFIKKIIQEFDPQTTLKSNEYVLNWIKKNGPKILQHSVNLEYAVYELEKIGLKQKLIALGDPKEEWSISWWMNKKPLPSFEVGKGNGKSAQELGISVVAHETNNFYSYESITKSQTNDPNVLVSRPGNVPGELAGSGEGFYTLKGRKGAKRTGMTIRFLLDPNAREGTDFIINNEEVIIKNKKAFKIIPETLKLSWLQYISFLANENRHNPDDRALVIRLKLGLSQQMGALSNDDFKVIDKIIKNEFKKKWPNSNLLSEVWPLFVQRKKTEFFKKRLYEAVEKNPNRNFLRELGLNFFKQPDFKEVESIVEFIFKKTDPHFLWDLAGLAFVNQDVQNSEESLKFLIKHGNNETLSVLAKDVFKKIETKNMSEALMQLIEKGDEKVLTHLAFSVFSQPHSLDKIAHLERIIEKGNEGILSTLASNAFEVDLKPEKMRLLKQVIEKGGKNTLWNLSFHLFSKPGSEKMASLLKVLIDRADQSVLISLLSNVFSKPHSQEMIDLLKLIMEKLDSENLVALDEYVFSKSFAQNQQYYILRQARNIVDTQQRVDFFKKHYSLKNPEIFRPVQPEAQTQKNAKCIIKSLISKVFRSFTR